MNSAVARNLERVVSFGNSCHVIFQKDVTLRNTSGNDVLRQIIRLQNVFFTISYISLTSMLIYCRNESSAAKGDHTTDKLPSEIPKNNNFTLSFPLVFHEPDAKENIGGKCRAHSSSSSSS